jgi:phosphohistidine phosphatase
MSKKSGPGDAFYLVRHGIAEDRHPLGDKARALTPEGRRGFRDLAADIGPKLGLVGIVSSPLVRAVQTAEILAEAAGIEEVRVENALEADEGTAAAITALALKLGPGWALVGHNPSLALTLGTWFGRGPSEPQFRKGAIAAFRPGDAMKPPFSPVFIVSPGRDKETF